ncbi:hypothetical protein SAMN02745746_03763 [Pseudogulbenkiania subflava DSM 22618]|uniref:Uncharacterized protein n=1 Tax=Pseudogulbenkiania subflava DSM 22618 TaxID=1123014 RepID=A0A1Y6CB37_9NEIS|nr:hypothetical protein SAMN02745746_03763 [Pseudogulbenkiania subflava DSM 22618]
MSFWNRLFGQASTAEEAPHPEATSVVNPATGLLMIDNTIGGVDAGGSPFGQDVHHHHSCSGNQSWAPLNHGPDSL